MDVSASFNIVQITNVSAFASVDEMNKLFGFLGEIKDIKLYPSDDYLMQSQFRICYVKYAESWSVHVAEHLTNTVFFDRALIVMPFKGNCIPTEEKINLDFLNPAPALPALVTLGKNDLINDIAAIDEQLVITTIDPNLAILGLPQYPPLSAHLDPSQIDETRRTVYIGNLNPAVTPQHFLRFINQIIGEVKYVRMAGDGSHSSKFAFVEFTERASVIKALQSDGVLFDGEKLKITHSTTAIVKSQRKTDASGEKEIEEAMKRVREAEDLITAVVEPEISGNRKRHRHKRSRSQSRSRSRHRHHSSSRHHSRSDPRRLRHRSTSRSPRHRPTSRPHSRTRILRNRSRSISRRSRYLSRSRTARSRDRSRSSQRSVRRSRSGSRRSRYRSRSGSRRSRHHSRSASRRSRYRSRSASRRYRRSPSHNRISERVSKSPGKKNSLKNEHRTRSRSVSVPKLPSSKAKGQGSGKSDSPSSQMSEELVEVVSGTQENNTSTRPSSCDKNSDLKDLLQSVENAQFSNKTQSFEHNMSKNHSDTITKSEINISSDVTKSSSNIVLKSVIACQEIPLPLSSGISDVKSFSQEMKPMEKNGFTVKSAVVPKCNSIEFPHTFNDPKSIESFKSSNEMEKLNANDRYSYKSTDGEWKRMKEKNEVVLKSEICLKGNLQSSSSGQNCIGNSNPNKQTADEVPDLKTPSKDLQHAETKIARELVKSEVVLKGNPPELLSHSNSSEHSKSQKKNEQVKAGDSKSSDKVMKPRDTNKRKSAHRHRTRQYRRRSMSRERSRSYSTSPRRVHRSRSDRARRSRSRSGRSYHRRYRTRSSSSDTVSSA